MRRGPSQQLFEMGRPDVFAAKLDPQFERYRHSRLLASKFRSLTFGNSPRQIWTMQPQLGKTTMGSIWGPSWALDWDPRLHFMLLSYAARLSARNAGLVRNIIRDNSKHLRTELRPDSTAKDLWHTADGGGLLSSGVDGSIHGFSGSVIVIDDPHKNRREANSALRRDQVWEWWTDDVQSRLQGEERVLIVMTRWHPEDLVARVLEAEGERRWVDGKWEGDGDWEVTHIPALADSTITPHGDPLGREDGEPACPERFSREVMERRRTSVGPIAWASLYQGVPTVQEGDVLKRSSWRLLDEILNQAWASIIITSWDMAGGDSEPNPSKRTTKKKSDKGSYSVGQVWMKDYHANTGRARYTLLDQVRGKWDLPEQIAQVQRMHARYPRASHHLVENASNGRAVLQHIGMTIPGMTPINPGTLGSKFDRAVSTTPTLDAGDIWLPNYVGTTDEINDDATWVDKFINECSDFPNGANDDQVDTYSQAINWFLLNDVDASSQEYEIETGR